MYLRNFQAASLFLPAAFSVKPAQQSALALPFGPAGGLVTPNFRSGFFKKSFNGQRPVHDIATLPVWKRSTPLSASKSALLGATLCFKIRSAYHCTASTVALLFI